jgi:hypothetical protein
MMKMDLTSALLYHRSAINILAQSTTYVEFDHHERGLLFVCCRHPADVQPFTFFWVGKENNNYRVLQTSDTLDNQKLSGISCADILCLRVFSNFFYKKSARTYIIITPVCASLKKELNNLFVVYRIRSRSYNGGYSK